ncbi:hypothetical protein ACFUC1_02450 [Pedococcus sp. NPDC057267]|uniref:hypothetical protein n=1 Tax=Pedococcus sp. NPDC057267 TaxID=3346077 RepID=UPI00363D6D05
MSHSFPVIDWGSVPDWIAGLGTAAALFFAFAGWRIAVQERHASAAAQREQNNRDRRAHAQQFTCWAAGGSSTNVAGQIQYGVSVHVLNNSPHTFLNVEVKATARGPGRWREEASVLWPRLTPSPIAVDESQQVTVLHDDTGERPLVMPTWNTEALFTDVNGVRWRYKNGAFDEATETTPAR